MPFEGAGAAGNWTLTLPKAVKTFDYNTISDVIVRLNYTAEEDADFRTAVEESTGVLSTLADTGITQVLSLRHDFPAAWHQLLGGAAQVTIKIESVHLPFFISTFDLQRTRFDILVNTLSADDGAYPTVSFDEKVTTDPGDDDASGMYLLGTSTDAVDIVESHTLAVTSLGGAAVPSVGG
jgi:hypothetical protein